MNKLSRHVDVKVIGARLRQMRELRALSLGNVANEATVAKSYLAKLERGDVPNPGLVTIARIAEVLGTTLDALLVPVSGSHERTRWTNVVGPLEMEQIRQTMPAALNEFLHDIEQESGAPVPADIVRSLALLQFRGKRPASVPDWRFVYEAIQRSVR